jgi:hypothetical protein
VLAYIVEVDKGANEERLVLLDKESNRSVPEQVLPEFLFEAIKTLIIKSVSLTIGGT